MAEPFTPEELRALQERLEGQAFLAPWEASDARGGLLENMGRHIESRQWPVLRERCLKAVRNG